MKFQEIARLKEWSMVWLRVVGVKASALRLPPEPKRHIIKIMSDEELIRKAREHAKLFLEEMSIDSKRLEEVLSVREAFIVRFGKDESSSMTVTVDKKTGEFIGSEIPGQLPK